MGMSTWGQAEIGDDEYEAAITELTKPPPVPPGEAVGSHPGTALEWSARRHETPVPSGGQADGEGVRLRDDERDAIALAKHRTWHIACDGRCGGTLNDWISVDRELVPAVERILTARLAARPVLSREALLDQIADAIGAMPEASNVTDYTDEQTTMITAPVERIADAVLDVLHPQDGGRP